MLVNATFVPDTALLVPGAAGAAQVLADVRDAAVTAVQELVEDAPARVVVVVPGTADRTTPGPLRPCLGAAGIDDAHLGWAVRASGDAAGLPTTADAPATAVHHPASATALLLLAHAGWTGPVTLVEVAAPGPDERTRAPDRGRDLAALGREVSGSDRVALVVAGSLSARRGPDAPVPDDERAPAVDEALLTDLADGGPAARRRLADLTPDLAAELAVTAWAPWRMALGAVPDDAPVRARVHAAAAPFGVTYVVASWRPA